ncbi:MAG: ABC transporter substrate-binding protein [Ruminococcaceae bacterium]|nr:ABC transporter substrate-binding protein [Oscillospiraceae bacterium]
MSKNKMIAALLALCMALSLAACGGGQTAPETGTQTPAAPAAETPAAPAQTQPEPAAAPAQPKQLRLAESFAYASLDAHKDYYGWYTSIYGVTETLFKVGDDLSVQPLLAKDYSVSDDDKTWTVTLADGAAFSNGTSVTADMVKRNLERLAEVNERFAYLADYTFAVVDDHTLTITTPDVYPTMLSDLTAPEFAILDLDGTTDFDNAPVGTGPFVVKSFEPEGTVEVEKNTAYWNGDVKLDGATFYYMQDDETKLMAMQSGDIDGYTSVTAAAKEIYAADPATYQLTVIPATRLQFYVLNKNRMDDAVRAAVNLTVDCDAIAAFLGGTVSAAVGPFSPSAPYGKVTKPAVDTAKAKALLEADGYALNASGVYEKDGKPLSLNICYYAARSLDSISLLMQEQLKAIGVDATLTVQEDPDATYVASGDYDIALYCMIADKAGDPYYCCNALFRQDSRWALAGFPTAESEALINKLQSETDVNQRAALANQIVQMTIDDNAYGYVGLFNKTTVTQNGVTGIAESCPFDFYGISADTDMAS